MTARTGSTHLAALLAGSGQMAAPDEILNPRSVAQVVKWKRNVGDFAGLIEAVNADAYPWFGFKACFQDFAPIAGFYGALFPDARFVYLSRREVYAQAVSLFRACLSDRWHEDVAAPVDEEEMALERARLRGKFDLAALRGTLKGILDEMGAWEGFFKAEGILPVRVTYEDVLADADGVLGRIGDEVGTDFLPAPPPKYRKLADALSEEWLHQLRLDQLGMT